MHAFRGSLALCAVLALSRGPAAAVEAGQPAPPLAAPTLDGQHFDLASDRGRVVLVHYWASWCVPCREEMPALDAFYRRYHAQGVEMVAVSADRFRDRGAAEKMARGFAYPAAMLSDARPNGFGNPGSLPETIVIDKAGTVRAVLRPDQTPVTEQSLTAAVLPLLNSGR